MQTQARATTERPLPCRMAFVVRGNLHTTVVAGTPGSHGDAGWAVVVCVDDADRERVAREYPEARMPCWNRLGL